MKNRFKNLHLVISVALFIVFFSSFIFLYKIIKNNIEDAKQAEIDLQKEISKRDEIKNLNNYFKSIEKEKALLETHFVQDSDVVVFLNTLENMAVSVGTSAQINSINIEKDSGLYIQINNRGSFSGVYKFITLLENAPYELQILSSDLYKVSDLDSKKKSGEWEVALRLKLISFK